MVVQRRKKATAPDATFLFDGKPLEIVKEYKYLGLMFSSNRTTFNHAPMTLANQANKRLFLAIKWTIRHEYGSEKWGHHPRPEIETIHLKFYKFALGVPTSACNLACYGEFGRSLVT